MAYTHCPFLHKVGVETLRSSDQIGSTERVRSIGLTATAQIHGRPRNIPWPQSRPAIHPHLPPPPPPLPRTSLPASFLRTPKCRSLPRCASRFCIISSRLVRIKALPREEEDFGARAVCELADRLREYELL